MKKSRPVADICRPDTLKATRPSWSVMGYSMAGIRPKVICHDIEASGVLAVQWKAADDDLADLMMMREHK